MKGENKLYLAILLTVVVARLLVFVNPSHLVVFGIIIHHFWIGIFLILASFLLKKEWKIFCLGIGLGLFVDEFGFIIKAVGSFPEYWSTFSVTVAISLLGIFYLMKKSIYKSIS